MPVITCSDMDLMRTAGMDSLMLNWQNTLGIQIFFPLTIVGLAVCEAPPSYNKWLSAMERDLLLSAVQTWLHASIQGP